MDENRLKYSPPHTQTTQQKSYGKGHNNIPIEWSISGWVVSSRPIEKKIIIRTRIKTYYAPRHTP